MGGFDDPEQLWDTVKPFKSTPTTNSTVITTIFNRLSISITINAVMVEEPEVDASF